MILYEWAEKWGISHEALSDLLKLSNISLTNQYSLNRLSETDVQSNVRLEASSQGAVLWRNNVGAYKTDKGRHVRYGLANDSARMNHKIKSSDLIGITPVVIRPEHLSQTIGVFTARECKKHDWVYKGTDRENAQLNYINLVNSLGGDARFTTGVF